MGLFSFLKKKPAKKPARKKAKPQGPELMWVSAPSSDVYEIPQGEYETTFYVYDGRPLGHPTKGDVLRLTLVHGDYDMRSIYTGGTCSARKMGATNLCATYKGYAVGYLASSQREIVQLVARNSEVTFAARYDGMDPNGGYPKLVALLPTKGELKLALGIHDYTNDPNCIRTTVPDQLWVGEVDDGSHELALRALPVPNGSSAKPHIEILLDGIVCAELAARQGCYGTFAGLLDAQIVSCKLTTTTFESGYTKHMLDIQRA